ncbi:hypothetical protein M408DRAFT_325559 [Serendipita vermifera MAFF 305830]|uniref:Uncharacterized protein n=1 Tax=Serendipita vermifera MAFF 305830 TaxID=933852 RepID=A0A0C3BRC8_SERVB|nr:hypothetical protein M408DRAFT_325559 [Serendipita vermifera MAFF 305830]
MSAEDASLAAKGIVIIIPIPDVHDNWSAPPLVKASFAFEIIWFIISLFQLLGLFNYTQLPAGTRRPYVILIYATLATVVYYLMVAIGTNLQGRVHYVITDRMNIATSFFYIVAVVLQPVASLSLARQLGFALQSARSLANGPIVSRPWKRTLDWTLVGVTFIIYIAALGNNASYVAAARRETPTTSQSQAYSRTSLALGHTITALVVVLSLNVIISLISLFRAAKRVQWSDQTFARLGYVIVPFSAAYALQWLIFHIYFATTSSTSTSYNVLAANFARVMVEGVCRIAITGGLLANLPEPPKKAPKAPKTTTQQTPTTTAAMQQIPVYQPNTPIPSSYTQPSQPYAVRTNDDYR